MSILKDLTFIFLLLTSLYFCINYLNLKYKHKRLIEYFNDTLIHDLKTPTLAQLRGLELLSNETVGIINSEQKELISQIKKSCKYALDMISVVLNTYRFESGQKKFFMEEFNLSELLIECFNETFPLAQEKKIDFSYMTEDENLFVYADKNDIKTVIISLLLNAIMYSKQDSTVNVKLDIVFDKVKLEITSCGITFSEHECKTMFNQATGRNLGYTTIGNGINLYLSRKIIEGHNGEIFASTDGESFNKLIFILPMRTANSLNLLLSSTPI